MAKKSKTGPIEEASRKVVEKMRARETPADPNKRWLAESDGKRVEAAARALDPWAFDSPMLNDPEIEGARQNAKRQAEAAVRAYYPELFSSPPASWLAPRHMTNAMVEAIEGKVSHMDRSTDELVNFDFAQADRFWRTVRDTCAEEQGGT